MYFGSQHRVVNIVMNNNTVSRFYDKLDMVEQQIDRICDFFLRISKSYLINLMCIRSVRSTSITMYGRFIQKICRFVQQPHLFDRMLYSDYIKYFIEEMDMKRIIVLDTSGVYSQIYDEVYASGDEWKEIAAKYRAQGYVCVVLTY